MNEVDENKKASSKPTNLWRPAALLGLIISAFVLARVFNVGDRLGSVRDLIEGLGLWGVAVFILLYVAATVAALPGSAITIAAGALFGSLIGVAIVSVASTLGAGVSFLIARYFARDAVAEWLSTKEKFQQLDKLTEERGAIIVALTRLVPIFPFNLLNYGFGLTAVRFRTYIFWSWLCMLPGTVLYVAGADAVFKGVSEGRIPWILITVVAVMLVLLSLIVRYARRKLNAEEVEKPGTA